jgi:hypothetical protein
MKIEVGKKGLSSRPLTNFNILPKYRTYEFNVFCIYEFFISKKIK